MHQCVKFILFWNETLHVSDGLSIRHQEFKTVHIATGICQTDTAVCLQQAFVKQILLSAATGICQTDTAVCLLQAFVKQILLSAATGICQTDTAVCLLNQTAVSV